MSLSRIAQGAAAALEKLLALICLGLMFVIVGTMSTQILFRAVPSVNLTNTDEIAQIALSWLTFLGAAWIYRTGEHITVDLLPMGAPAGWWSRSLIILRELIVLAIMINLLLLIHQAMPMAMRLRMGTLELSRFVMHFLPLGLGLAGICLFALERILRAVLGQAQIEHTLPQELL